MTEQRFASSKEAAAYCGLSVAGFRAFLKRRRLKIKVDGANLYDLKALNLTMDRLHGIGPEPVIEDDGAYFRRQLRKADKNEVFATKYQHSAERRQTLPL